MRHCLSLSCLVLIVCVGCDSGSVSAVPKKVELTPQEASAVSEFNERLRKYLDLRNQAESGLPKLKPTPEPAEMEAHKKAFAADVARRRAGVEPGEIFTPAVSRYFVDVIGRQMGGRESESSRKALKEDAPPALALKVNAPYPDSQPLSTVPPALLLQLPTLPKQVDYRFAGRTLILHDVDADLIVDYIPNAVPVK